MNNIFENERIRLSVNDKFRYYRLPLLFLISSVLSFTGGFTELYLKSLNEYSSNKIGIILLIFSLTTFCYFYYYLKLKTVKFSNKKSEIIKRIENLIDEKSEWKLIEKTERHFIIETNENSKNIGISRNSIISPNVGNRIFIMLENNKLFVRSLFNLSDKSILVIDNGESRKNEKTIIQLTKSTANNMYN